MFNIDNFKKAAAALPDIEPSQVGMIDEPLIYIPKEHIKALSYDSALVEGIRGSGKTFWWNILSSEKHRDYLKKLYTEIDSQLSGIVIKQGYGTIPNPDLYPDKDSLKSFIDLGFEARDIWKTVIAVALGFFQENHILMKWKDKINYLKEHVEEFSSYLYQQEQQYKSENKKLLIIFDALDRLANDWSNLRPLAKALFQLAQDFSSYQAIRLKLFVRPDMIEDKSIFSFPDASKLKARKAELLWSKLDLYALFFFFFANDDDFGKEFRDYCPNVDFELVWKNVDGKSWIIPKVLRTNEQVQKKLFNEIAGSRMSVGAKSRSGLPYTWLVNRLGDGNEQVSPRSFMAAIKKAATFERTDNWMFPLHFKGLKEGVQTASQIRIEETKEDYPWISKVMSDLKGLTVPCSQSDFTDRWTKCNTVDDGAVKNADKLPPQHIEEREKGLLEDLKELNYIQIMKDGRVQMPDVYRIAFGLGRKGGVRPVK